MEENELIIKLKEKDDEAFRYLVNTYQKFVLNICFKFVNNKEIAEDLTQDVFIEIHKSINVFRMDSKLSTWIYRISVSKSLDYLKSQRRKKRFARLTSLFGESNLSERIFSPENQNPGKIIENEDRVKILQMALDKIPENQRTAFILSKSDGMSYNEIADIMDLSLSAVESLLFRAKSNLKKKLYNYYEKLI